MKNNLFIKVIKKIFLKLNAIFRFFAIQILFWIAIGTSYIISRLAGKKFYKNTGTWDSKFSSTSFNRLS